MRLHVVDDVDIFVHEPRTHAGNQRDELGIFIERMKGSDSVEGLEVRVHGSL